MFINTKLCLAIFFIIAQQPRMLFTLIYRKDTKNKMIRFCLNVMFGFCLQMVPGLWLDRNDQQIYGAAPSAQGRFPWQPHLHDCLMVQSSCNLAPMCVHLWLILISFLSIKLHTIVFLLTVVSLMITQVVSYTFFLELCLFGVMCLFLIVV